VRVEQRERQVLAHTKVCLDLPDRHLSEPPQTQICTTMATAYEFAKETAVSRSLPVIWAGGEFVASVVFGGSSWVASWSIRVHQIEVESDCRNYRDEATARQMVRIDARNRGCVSRITWADGFVGKEPMPESRGRIKRGGDSGRK
jgi:hypothetical protein